MKKLLFAGCIGVVMALGLVLAGCKDNASGCKGDGACYFIRSNQDYKWCGVEGCSVWKSPDTGQSSISCNC